MRPSSHTHLHRNHQTLTEMENSMKSIIKENLGLLASIKPSCFSFSPKQISKIPSPKHRRSFLLDFFFPSTYKTHFFTCLSSIGAEESQPANKMHVAAPAGEPRGPSRYLGQEKSGCYGRAATSTIPARRLLLLPSPDVTSVQGYGA